MRAALALARRGLGQVAPNPAVGCVILDADGFVAGRGWTQPGGRPHAETEALTRAGDAARGGTAYVSLEPCSHTGETGPCAEALVAAQIARVVIAAEDPDPRVGGSGIQRLKDAGVAIRVGVLRGDAERLNAGFIMRVTRGRPMVTLKCASTLDGRIATHTGESQWITGETARAWGHGLRAAHDAIITGASTVRADDPELTCRLPGLTDASPLRVVLDSGLSLPLTSKLVASAGDHPLIVFTVKGADSVRAEALSDLGVEILEVGADDGGRPDIGEALTALAARGITRVLVEGGAKIAAGFLRARVVDRIAWFRSPDVLGGDGVPAVEGFGTDTLSDMIDFRRLRMIPAGQDVLEIYERAGA
jgi:diaminohydroxyphosphoribosylaminopyrimidine deaminase/5-amino-6-(5-phosphoribosylamino)uracil reductase